MEQNLRRRRERGSLAPFVGVTLAALTVGSLVLFSVVAQRTSLEAFSSRGVAVAPVPSGETTGSITLPAPPEVDSSQRGSEGTGGDETAERDASELLFVTDDDTVVSTTAAVQDAQSAAADADTPIAEDGDADVTAAADADVTAAAADADALSPFFSMAAGGAENGQVDATTDAKKAKGRDGNKKAARDKKAKKDKKSKKARASGRSDSRDRSARADSNRSSRSASTRRASKPTASSMPAQVSRSSAPKPRSSSKHHSQRGKGHSKSRGKAHRH